MGAPRSLAPGEAIDTVAVATVAVATGAGG